MSNLQIQCNKTDFALDLSIVHDFNCTEAKDMYYNELAERVKYFKEAKKGVEIMCRTIEVMRNESEIQGAIKAYKNLKLKDEEIVEFLLSSYDFLSEAEAEKLVEEFNKD